MGLLVLLASMQPGALLAQAGAASSPELLAAPVHGEESAAARCQALAGADFSHTPDALIQLSETQVVAATDHLPGYCQVSGYVAPSIGFLLRLPLAGWNGKLMESGCGGFCGTYDNAMLGCDVPLHRGYACVVSDGGHKGDGIKWAFNNLQAKFDVAYHAPHVAALAGKAIVQRYYQQAPRKSYFMGCSGGGSQGMWEAQRYPRDFDGIIAGAPDLSWTGVVANWLWNYRAVKDPNGKLLLGQPELEMLYQAVVARCDLNDGIKDGLIGDPRQCAFDPEELRCSAKQTTHCLTAAQIEAVQKVYRGPVSSRGEQLFLPSAQKGSERTWRLFTVTAESNSGVDGFWGDSFRYITFDPDPGPSWQLKDFDFDRDPQRMQMMEGLGPVNPDLRRFRAAGGKLLSYTGWSDQAEGVLRTVDYYETAERVIGSRAATQAFYRLFVIPGMNHCGGGEGAYAVDYLTVLEQWVEQGQAPEQLLGYHLQHDVPRLWQAQFPLDPANIAFSRPVYPYPVQARYSGHGDPNEAASFVPQNSH